MPNSEQFSADRRRLIRALDDLRSILVADRTESAVATAPAAADAPKPDKEELGFDLRNAARCLWLTLRGDAFDSLSMVDMDAATWLARRVDQMALDLANAIAG